MTVFRDLYNSARQGLDDLRSSAITPPEYYSLIDRSVPVDSDLVSHIREWYSDYKSPAKSMLILLDQIQQVVFPEVVARRHADRVAGELHGENGMEVIAMIDLTVPIDDQLRRAAA